MVKGRGVAMQATLMKLVMVNRKWYTSSQLGGFSSVSNDGSIVEVDKIWFCDSGCSVHMTNNPTALIDPKPVVRSSVTVGDGKVLQVSVIGNLSLSCVQNGEVSNFILHNVSFVPGLKFNLLSMIQAGEQSEGELYWKGENSLRL
ncbi:unnamed protein product, partial [Choristocarpus tenellus]